MSILGIKDLIFTPFYLFFIYIIAYIYKSRFIKKKEHKKYFIPALTLKLVGAIGLGLIYEYYYNGGDTTNYFSDISVIFETLITEPSIGIRLIFLNTGADNYELSEYLNLLIFGKDPASYTVVRIGAVISIFTFCTYSVIAVFFGVLSFIAIWHLFISLTDIYPNLHKQFAICIFFIPSVFFWGSGLMKDSITLGALSMCFYAFTQIFIKGNKRPSIIFLLLANIYLLKEIKIYIALCFIPAALLYLFILFNHKIRSKMLRQFIKPILISIGLVISFFAASTFAEGDSKYNLDNLAQTAKTTSHYIAYVSKNQGGAYYSLGDYDPTWSGMLQKLPEAIWVTLFRPYIWESKNIVMILSALESFIFLFLTLKAFYKTGITNVFKTINSQPYIQFALFYSLAFAFAIGISTYNFGALVRYKIPIMPFYLSCIYIILELNKKTAPKSKFLPKTVLHQ